MGQGGVGKTALVTRFSRDEFLEGVSLLGVLRIDFACPCQPAGLAGLWQRSMGGALRPLVGAGDAGSARSAHLR